MITEISKYLMAILIAVYALVAFTIFGNSNPSQQKGMLRSQNVLMFLLHADAYMVLYLQTDDIRILAFYVMQVILFAATLILYNMIYPLVSRLVVNNMLMLLCIGFIMLTRLDYDSAMRQFIIAAVSIAISLLVPVFIRRFKRLSEWRSFYAIAGLISLGIVLVLGRVTGGAYLSFEVAGISIQPSELVKIIFVFFVAASFKRSRQFRDIMITTAVAALHVLILVVSRDLGCALIIFVVYLVMLYVATRQPLYIAAGLGAGAVASVGAYYLFDHIRVRVVAWRDPFGSYDQGGYQIAQSLFAIGTGSWFGMGLFMGSPDTIPVNTSDAIFSAIAEEMGLIFALSMLLICLSVYIMFLNIALQLHDMFYKLVALGLGTCYIFQTFLNVGGMTKFIPMTGVTLPLVSYGGSSLFSTLIMFAIIQGLYILREDEEDDLEKRKKEKLRAARGGQGTRGKSSASANVQSGSKGSQRSGQAQKKEKKSSK